jgi:hypothetical protein
MQIETISQETSIDERRALMMSLQALLDLDMLAVIAALMNGERSLPDLSNQFKVLPSLSRGPIGRLIFLEIIEAHQSDNTVMCQLNRTRFHELNGMVQRLSKEWFAAERPATPADSAAMAVQDRKILQSCFRGDQLYEIPSNPRRLELVLHWLVEQFEMERHYAEKEVNEIIKRYHPDFATLRRHLIDHALMERENNIYWRT